MSELYEFVRQLTNSSLHSLNAFGASSSGGVGYDT